MGLPSATASKKTGRKGKSVSFLRQGSITTSIATGVAGATNVSIASITSITYRANVTRTSNTKLTDTGIASTSTSATTTISVVQDTSLLTPPIPGDRAAVSLCERLSAAKEGPPLHCYGLVVDPSDGKEYGVYPAATAKDGRRAWPWSTVSLRQVLRQQAGTPLLVEAGKGKDVSLPNLTYQDRLALALSISSSVLQLHETPWLGGRAFTCDDILFLDHYRGGDGGDGGGVTPMYAQAFVATSVPGSPGADVAARVAVNAGSDFDLTLLWLGVLLIELVLGHVFCLADDPKALEVYTTAKKMLYEVEQRSGIDYAGAVQWCLDQRRRKLNIEDDMCQQDIYKNVVALLEDAYRLAQD